MPVGSLSSGGRHPGRQETTDKLLTPTQAAAFARLALANVEREFPNKLDHVMASAADVASPRALHPAFFGSFDWHSCVHAHWLLARILRLRADIAEAALIRRTLDSHLSAANVAAEVAYFRRPESRAEFRDWLARFLPGIEKREPATLFKPAVVSNRSDPYIVHLDGLNRSRVCWRAIGRALPSDDPCAMIATTAADAHLAAGMAGVSSGEYIGDHWLATFAVLALTT
jgi:hypothetical protein